MCDETALARATDGMVPFLKENLAGCYLNIFDGVLELRNTRLEGEEEKMRDTLARVEQMSKDDTSLAEEGALVQLALAEAELESMQRLRKDLPQLINEAFSVQILDETGVARTRTPAALFFLAITGSLGAALALAFFREVIVRRKR